MLGLFKNSFYNIEIKKNLWLNYNLNKKKKIKFKNSGLKFNPTIYHQILKIMSCLQFHLD
jgi:hypothetical protein